MKRKIIIIHNPLSGKKRNINLFPVVSKYLNPSLFEFEIWKSENMAEIASMSEKAASSDADIVVAAGGDGTVNIVSEKLVGTSKKFYVFPLGSGNGFARHFGISVNLEKAIQQLSAGLQEKRTDTALLDNHYFANVAGVGFDAHISHVFAQKNKRGFWGYFRAVFKELGYKGKEYEVECGGETWKGTAFLISVANCSQWGNNVYIAPHANAQDGRLDMVIIKKINLWTLPLVLYKLLAGKVEQGKFFHLMTGEKIKIRRKEEGAVHTDGEPLAAGKELSFSVNGKLNVLGEK